MKFNQLKLNANRSTTRVGRGIAAGKGKTAGRGTKGQKARAGSGKKEGFEGGQTPIMKRAPKLRGFRPHRNIKEQIYTSDLSVFKGSVNNHDLVTAGLIKTPYSIVKVILKGEVGVKLEVSLQAASVGAIEAIQKAGGKFTKVERLKSPSEDRESIKGK